MAAPLFPTNQVLLVSCMATICKVMCGMAAGATKASITAHFAIRLVFEIAVLLLHGCRTTLLAILFFHQPMFLETVIQGKHGRLKRQRIESGDLDDPCWYVTGYSFSKVATQHWQG